MNQESNYNDLTVVDGQVEMAVKASRHTRGKSERAVLTPRALSRRPAVRELRDQDATGLYE